MDSIVTNRLTHIYVHCNMQRNHNKTPHSNICKNTINESGWNLKKCPNNPQEGKKEAEE